MGSFFSSPGGVPDSFCIDEPEPASDWNPNARERKEEDDLCLAYQYASICLSRYNSTHPDAKYAIVDSKKYPRAACVGFRQDIWYHVGFWARRLDAVVAAELPQHYFFAEIRYERRPRRLIVETCTILEMPVCRYKSWCAFCPEKFGILHPRDTGLFICGKKRHKKKFFRRRNMLAIPFGCRHTELNSFASRKDDSTLN